MSCLSRPRASHVGPVVLGSKKNNSSTVHHASPTPPLPSVTSVLLLQLHVHFSARHSSVTQPPIARHRRLTWDQPPPANALWTRKDHRLQGDGQTSVICLEVVNPDIICINAEILNELFTAEQEKTHTHTTLAEILLTDAHGVSIILGGNDLKDSFTIFTCVESDRSVSSATIQQKPNEALAT